MEARYRSDDEIENDLKNLTNRKYVKVIIAFIIFVFLAGGISWALYATMGALKDANLEIIPYIIANIICAGLAVFITKELPYSLEQVTVRKGRWFICQDITHKLEILGKLSPDEEALLRKRVR